MPIEIRELVVHARVVPGAEPASPGASGGVGGVGAPAPGARPAENLETPEIVRAAVQEALRAFADRRER